MFLVRLERRTTLGYGHLVRVDHVLWSAANVDHVARHGILPEEVEDVFFTSPLDARRGERENTYLVLGCTRAGRQLLVVIAPRLANSWYVMTARDVTESREGG